MSMLSNPPVSVYSHPYRPELPALRVWLLSEGYHASAVETIVTHAAEHGTLEGLVDSGWLVEMDEAEAEAMFVGAMSPVPHVSSEWDDPGVWTDAESLCEALDPTFPRAWTANERTAAMSEVVAYYAARRAVDRRVDELIGGEWD